MNIDFLKNLYKSRLVKSGIWFTIGTFCIQGINFLTVPILTRLLSPSDFGMVGIYTIYVTILTSIISLGLESAVSTGKFDFKEDFDGFLSSILFLSTIPLFIGLIIALTFKQYIAGKLGINPGLINLLVFQSFFTFVLHFATTKYSVQYKYKKFLIISITSTVLNVLLSIAWIQNLNVDRYYGRIYGSASIAIIYGVVLYAIFILKGKKLINLKYWKYALGISVPLVFHILSQIILTSADTIMISKMIGKSAAGIYNFSYKIGMILSIVWAASNKAWVPWFFGKMKDENYEEITNKVRYYIIVFSLIAFMLIFISPEVSRLMGTKEYLEGIQMVPIIMIGYYFVFLYSIPVNLEFYTKNTKYIALGTVMAAGANIGLNYILIPKFGYTAAAFTTVISYFLLFLYHYIIALKVSDLRIFNIIDFLYGILFIALSSVIFYFTRDIWVIRYTIIVLLVVIGIFILKKKVIKV
ncbi:oligosaccharide flippase family protein [Clostridium sp.]|jgi:O-antigen/teichoic acid export membrane protein|uniref:lipopolysaccharide biosynthesis protein n=1 Tax=Clostridium sp. TaxID=1506 RepID=UPI003EECCB07